MSDPRWTDETETHIADALRRCDPYASTQPDDYHRLNARAVLKYLADTGLLAQPGGETETQHAVRWPSGWVQRFANRPLAEAKVKERHDWADGDPDHEDGVVVKRTVIRWREGRKTTATYTGARRCPECHGTTRCWACNGYNSGDDLDSGCTECDGRGHCQSCYEGWVDDA